MRAARLIKMVLLLQGRVSMSASDLARELDVSERTVTRDAQALAEAGVPVYAERGRAGGYRLIGGYRTRLTGLDRDEAAALFLSGVPGALREMGLEDAASAARLKVSAALLPSLRDAPASAGRRFHLDAPGWWQEPETPEHLPAVARAVWADLVVRVVYRRRDGESVARRLEPYGLVLKAGVWYVCARADGEHPGFRVYRIDRFGEVADGEEGFVRDESFDLPGFWAERAAGFARAMLRETVLVRVSAAGAARLPYVTDDRESVLAALEAAGEADERGRVTVALAVESYDVAFGQLMPLGQEVEVLEPAGLRERFADAARAMGVLYGRDHQGE
ncbi:WYL domain-containing protein [Streptomyces sp. BPTC-684]|uniref:helix-turn-helix transcriptional regulator n=1 Tax=Streptomyces sp. BPTC-684 TaxID=3043734 RepID=UPI0024B1E45B|nr:WYL domain-containing protein [Streptomyces sp. BPTC-684]WHM39024.1 WYL domain-containing protein [Streptomyces sp. BPTC-684]